MERLENGTQYAKKSVCEGEDEAAGREEEGKRERGGCTLIGAFCGTSVRAGVKVY